MAAAMQATPSEGVAEEQVRATREWSPGKTMLQGLRSAEAVEWMGREGPTVQGDFSSDPVTEPSNTRTESDEKPAPTDFLGFQMEGSRIIPDMSLVSGPLMPSGLQMPPEPLISQSLQYPPNHSLPAGLQMSPEPLISQSLQYPQNHSLPAGLQMSPEPLISQSLQYPQNHSLPADLQMSPEPLISQSIQYPQNPSLPAGFQMSPEPPVNPGFLDYPHRSNPPYPPIVVPQDPPRPQVPLRPQGRERRERTSYTTEQKEKLEAYFKECKYPTSEQRAKIARKIHVTENQVQVWFKNRRARYFREHPEERPQKPWSQNRA